jgi:hypothetical protein
MPAQAPRWKPGPLDTLLGAWTFEITQDLLPTTPDVWRQNSPFPIVTVIGTDDPNGAFSYLYADGRGVGRVYQMNWERSEDGQTWQRDFDIRYTKARSA